MDLESSLVFEREKKAMKKTPRRWLVTGVSGFIGSNLLEFLLEHDQLVIGIDNFSTGHRSNLEDVKKRCGVSKWKNFHFIEGDITHMDLCVEATKNADVVLHQAALGSIPRSIKDPIKVNEINVAGFLNMITAARDAGIRRFVYASSSSVYGDIATSPKVEDILGKQLSPYAVSKYTNELYAKVFSDLYGMETVGLRYFNVFGKRQNIHGPYAAVIPTWIRAMLTDTQVVIYGDGKTARDFCPVEDAIQMNVLSATTLNKSALNQVYNVALNRQTDLITLCHLIEKGLTQLEKNGKKVEPQFQEFRPGDIRHSLASIERAKAFLGYHPQVDLEEGLLKTMEWYIQNIATQVH